MWTLFVPIHAKISPKVKLGQVEVDSNIAQNHFHSSQEVILLIIYTNPYANIQDSGDTAH